MRRIRKLLLALGFAATLLLAFPIAASADPGDGGGFYDPTATTPVGTVTISAPGQVTIKGTAVTPFASNSASDPGDGGGF
ncbi:MAG: hypothetical protein KGJ98_02265 [Chloroflexota bacterium]|nr:hypothetical protein [Chloroflexota bacterium]MDE3101040.1 hypothetical protein [Chloroflexota bacterium]